MSLVVSDTSPIRALNHLDMLNLLRHLFDTVYAPPAVADELLNPSGRFVSIDVTRFTFIDIRSPQDFARVAQLGQTLDLGEAEAIALAIELGGATVLIDESHGRAAALSAKLPHIGVLGLLSRGKREELVSQVKPLVDRLRSELRFHVSDQLYQQYLISVHE